MIIYYLKNEFYLKSTKVTRFNYFVRNQLSLMVGLHKTKGKLMKKFLYKKYTWKIIKKPNNIPYFLKFLL